MEASGTSNRMFPVNSNGHHPPVEAPDLPLLQESVAQRFTGSVFQRTVILEKDVDEGFGFTVSGSSPVHVLRVKPASAAANAGVREGDLIIKVDGYPVSQVPHENVVDLIKNCQSYVTLTLLSADHAKMASNGSSASSYLPGNSPMSPTAPFNRPLPPTPGQSNFHRGSISERNITGPQPVDVRLQRLMDTEREKTLRQMLDKERNYSDSLRAELRKITDGQEKIDIQVRITNTEKIIQSLTEKLLGISGRPLTKQQPPVPGRDSNIPPPLPVRNKPLVSHTSAPALTADGPGRSLSPPSLHHTQRSMTSLRSADTGVPPPPPPPVPPHRVDPSQLAGCRHKSPCPEEKRKISESHLLPRGKSEDKILEEGDSQKFHKRARSSPEAIALDFSEKPTLKLSSTREDAESPGPSFTAALLSGCHPGSLLDSSGDIPYTTTSPSAKPHRSHSDYSGNRRIGSKDNDGNIKRPKSFVAGMEGGTGASGGNSPHDSGTPPHTPPNLRLGLQHAVFGSKLSRRSHAGVRRASENAFAGYGDSGSPGESPAQHNADIVAFEDDSGGSDHETSASSPAESRYGPFTNLAKLLDNNAHLAVFLNYLCLNEDPSYLFFYVITDFYKEGNVKEMRRWLYEIHSTFLVPGAPLQIENVDDALLREIDLTMEPHHADSEAQLKKIFWRARNLAKVRLKAQLDDFRKKIVEGMGSLYGCNELENIKDKEKEARFVEYTLLSFAKEWLTDFENESEQPNAERKIAVAIALATLLSKTFALNRSVQIGPLLERCPAFVSKDAKSFKAKHFLQRNKKVNVHGHQFIAQTYSTLTYCTICQQIIWGIGPQGYQCSTCDFNIHKWCIRQVTEECAQVDKKGKEGRFSVLFQKRMEGRRKASVQIDKARSKTGEVDPDHLEAADKVGHVGAFGSRKSEPPLAPSAEDAHKDSTDSHSSHSKGPLDFSEAIRSSARRSATSISRSESYRERQNKQRREKRKHSDPNLPPSKSADAEHDTPYLSGDNTESSSNSSLSNTRYGSFDSPCASMETVPTSGLGRSPSDASSSTIQQTQYQADSDEDADPTPDWQSRVDPEVLPTLTDREKKRQDVLNELFNTERNHVHNLKVLSRVFHRPMLENNLAPAHLLLGLFSNLDEMLDIHGRFSEKMKQKRRAKAVDTGDNSSGSPTGPGPKKDGPGCWIVVSDVGDLLLSMFDGENGERLAEAAAKFCRSQSLALTQLRMREKADPKLKNFLQDAASNPLCRRLQLKDFIPLGMQRLTKYPLLLENLVKYSGPNAPSEAGSTGDTTISLVADWDEEVDKIRRALQGSRLILNQVNQAKKDFENHERMLEIQKRLEKSSFEKSDHPIAKQYRSLELTKYRMVHEGRVTWRVSNPPKNLDLHMVLTDKFLMLLQKDGDKFHLKFHSINFVSGKEESKLQHSPIINTETLLVRQVATDKKAFFLVNSSDMGPQMYHIIAPSVQEWKTWFRHIAEATESCKKDKAKVPPENPGLTGLDDEEEDSATAHAGHSQLKEEGNVENEAAAQSTPNQVESVDTSTSERQQKLGGSAGKGEGANGLSPKSSFTAGSAQSGGSSPTPQRRFQRVEILQIAEGTQLIEPSEVVVSHGPASILTAEPILTPIEKLRRKDAEIRANLEQKRALVAELLHVPASDFETIADMAAHAHETSTFASRDTQEILVAAVGQVMRLTEFVNELYQVNEEDAVAATSGDSKRDSGKGALSPSKNMKKTLRVPVTMAVKMEELSTTLSSQLTEMLNILQQEEKVKDQLRKELKNAKEQAHSSFREDVGEARLGTRRKRLGNREKKTSGAGLSTESDVTDGKDEAHLEGDEQRARDPSPSSPVESPKADGDGKLEKGDGKKGSKTQLDEQTEATSPEEGAVGAADDRSGGIGGQQRVKIGKKRGSTSGGKQKRGKALPSPGQIEPNS